MSKKNEESTISPEIYLKDGNKYFEIGVSHGMKTFERILIISVAALGFLFGIMKSTEIGKWESSFILLAAMGFGGAIFFGLKRNYHSGYGLVQKGRSLIAKGENNLKKIKEWNDKKRKSEEKRESYSKIARFSFYLGITSIILILVKAPFLIFFCGLK